MTHPALVAGLLLAAGQSKRFGRNKLIEPIGGEPMIRRTAQIWLTASVDTLHVVTGGHPAKVTQALAGLNVTLIDNPHFEDGLASSIAVGLASFHSKYDFFLIGLADMPYVKAETLNALLKAAKAANSDKRLWVPDYAGRQGNPVLWHRLARQDLLNLTGDQGGRQLFQAYKDVLETVAVADPGIHWDVDRPEDLKPAPKKKADQ